ncbi:MAG: HU family DNA-binding protein [Chloroflexi bacterium]|nr:HU family DNA-binding protein [Chloroflexota bacterium]
MAKGMSKSDFIAAVAAKASLEKKQAGAVLDAINEVVVAELKGGNEVTLPGLLKMKVSIKPATPERPGVNPFTKQPITIAAKPERRVVKAAAIKALKDAL